MQVLSPRRMNATDTNIFLIPSVIPLEQFVQKSFFLFFDRIISGDAYIHAMDASGVSETVSPRKQHPQYEQYLAIIGIVAAHFGQN